MPFDPELEKAVALCKSDEPVTLKKHEQYERLKLFANRQRLPAESPQQAFARFISKTPEGQVLYKEFTKATGVSVPIAKTGMQSGSDIDGDNDASNGETSHMQTLRSIATAIQTKHPELRLTKSAAMSLAIQTPAGAAAYLADRKSRLRVA
jgi:hypothetical protein